MKNAWLIFVLFTPAIVRAQTIVPAEKETTTYVQSWISINSAFRFSNRWGAVGDFHIRRNNFLNDDYFYFVNSYYVAPEETTIISSFCDYNGEFCSSIEKQNLIAVQFHPEKSSKAGLEFFKRWINNS